MELIKELFLPILLSSLSAFFAARFAFGKYKKEKRWDEKREKYSLVIESVEYVFAWYSFKQHNLGHDSILITFDSDTSQLDISMRVIQKYGIIGNLYFSKEFSKVLSDYYSELDTKLYYYHEAMECSNGIPERELQAEKHFYSSINDCSNKILIKLLEIYDSDFARK